MGGKRSREGFGASGTEPLIKLKVGPWQQEVEFLICLKPITVVPYRVAESEGFVPCYLLSTHHLLYQTG